MISCDRNGAEVSADLAAAAGRLEFATGVERVSGGGIDAVIACAGVGVPGPLSIAVNYFGMVASLELLRPLMTRSAAPRAVGIASMAAIHPVDAPLLELMLAGDEASALDRAALLASDDASAGVIYGTSKRAFAAWVRAKAPTDAWAGAGIPLNCIAPGIVLTPMTAPLMKTTWADDVKTGAPAPLNGMMTPDVPARLLMYLASEGNSHVCGQMVFIDSGAEAVLRPTVL